METSNMNFSDAIKHGAGGLPEGRISTAGLKKPTNIRNDKEVEGEINRICETLKDTCKYPRIHKQHDFYPLPAFIRPQRLEFEIHPILT